MLSVSMPPLICTQWWRSGSVGGMVGVTHQRGTATLFDWERDFDTKVWAGPRGLFRIKSGVLKSGNGCPTESKNYCVYSLPKNPDFNNVWVCVCPPALDLWMCHWPSLKLSSSYYTSFFVYSGGPFGLKMMRVWQEHFVSVLYHKTKGQHLSSGWDSSNHHKHSAIKE